MTYEHSIRVSRQRTSGLIGANLWSGVRLLYREGMSMMYLSRCDQHVISLFMWEEENSVAGAMEKNECRRGKPNA